MAENIDGSPATNLGAKTERLLVLVSEIFSGSCFGVTKTPAWIARSHADWNSSLSNIISAS